MKETIEINKEDIIGKCDDFLSGKISKREIIKHAEKLIVDERYKWDDEIISEIVYGWDTEKMNFPINSVNMKLWKQWLETGKNQLAEFNNWNFHIERQKATCKKYGSNWKPINKKLMVGCSDDLSKEPINGLRHPKEGNTTGWYIWSGDYSENNNFFKPVCAKHLLQRRPQIIKYLGLDIGFRFLADRNGHEDIWFDKEVKEMK